MAAEILGPGIEVAPVMAHPADRRRAGKQHERGREAYRAPDRLPPAPGGQDGQPGHVTETGR